METEAFARLLSKPVLTETVPGKYAGRNLADLDKSVREQVAQGTLARPVAPTAPLESKTLVTTRTPDGYIIEQVFNTALYLALCLIVGLLMFCIGSSLLYYYFVLGAPGGSGDPIAIILAGAGFAVGGPVVAICTPLARIRLEIRPDEVRRMFLLGHFTITSTRAAAGEIEEVLVDESTSRRTARRATGSDPVRYRLRRTRSLSPRLGLWTISPVRIECVKWVRA